MKAVGFPAALPIEKIKLHKKYILQLSSCVFLKMELYYNWQMINLQEHKFRRG